MNSYTEQSILHERRRHRFDAMVNPSYITVYHPSQLGKLLRRLSDSLMQWLTTGSMPRVTKDMRGGTEVWKVYDPISNSTRHFVEENDLRIWMEARYYQ